MIRIVSSFLKARLLLLTIAIIVLLVGLFMHRSNHPRNTSIIPSQKTAAHSAPNLTAPQASTSTTPSPKQSTSGPVGSGTGSELKSPYGTFVSNHHPYTSDTEVSICTTTPGATCYINFTSGDTTKKLEAQAVGGDGSVSWTWKVADAGLTSGSWQVTAVSSLNGQTKSTADQLALDVK